MSEQNLCIGCACFEDADYINAICNRIFGIVNTVCPCVECEKRRVCNDPCGNYIDYCDFIRLNTPDE